MVSACGCSAPGVGSNSRPDGVELLRRRTTRRHLAAVLPARALLLALMLIVVCTTSTAAMQATFNTHGTLTLPRFGVPLQPPFTTGDALLHGMRESGGCFRP